jgi:hypothetical protein
LRPRHALRQVRDKHGHQEGQADGTTEGQTYTQYQGLGDIIQQGADENGCAGAAGLVAGNVFAFPSALAVYQPVAAKEGERAQSKGHGHTPAAGHCCGHQFIGNGADERAGAEAYNHARVVRLVSPRPASI